MGMKGSWKLILVAVVIVVLISVSLLYYTGSQGYPASSPSGFAYFEEYSIGFVLEPELVADERSNWDDYERTLIQINTTSNEHLTLTKERHGFYSMNFKDMICGEDGLLYLAVGNPSRWEDYSGIEVFDIKLGRVIYHIEIESCERIFFQKNSADELFIFTHEPYRLYRIFGQSGSAQEINAFRGETIYSATYSEVDQTLFMGSRSDYYGSTPIWAYNLSTNEKVEILMVDGGLLAFDIRGDDLFFINISGLFSYNMASSQITNHNLDRWVLGDIAHDRALFATNNHTVIFPRLVIDHEGNITYPFSEEDTPFSWSSMGVDVSVNGQNLYIHHDQHSKGKQIYIVDVETLEIEEIWEGHL